LPARVGEWTVQAFAGQTGSGTMALDDASDGTLACPDQHRRRGDWLESRIASGLRSVGGTAKRFATTEEETEWEEIQ